MPRLPIPNYGKSAERLTMQDSSLPGRVAAAREAMTQEGARAAGTVYEVYDDIYTREALKQVAAATPVYQETVKTNMVETTPYTEDGKGVWTESRKTFNNYQKNGLDAVDAQLTNPYAKQLFRQKALEIDSALLPQWSAKMVGMERTDSLAAYNGAEEAHLQLNQFRAARESVIDSKMTGVRDAVTAEKILSGIDYGEYLHNNEIDVAESTLQGTWSGPKLVDTRQEINDDTKLSSADKGALIGQLETNMMNNFVNGFHSELIPIERQDGRIAAYEKGEELLKNFHQIPPEDLGGDEHWRHQVYAGLKTAQAHYKDAVKKDSKKLIVTEKIRNAYTGDKYNDDTLYDGGFNIMLGRDVSETGKWEQSDEGINDRELLENESQSLFGDAYNYTLYGNRIPPVLEGLLSAALEKPEKPEHLKNSLDFIGRLMTSRPETINWQSKQTHVQDVAQLVDFFGNNDTGRARAYSMWKEWKAVENDDGKLAAREELAKSSKSKEYFYENFESSIKAKYGKDKGLMFFDKSLEVKATLKADSLATYNKFMLMTGDPGSAMALTTNAMRYTYGATKVGSSSDLKLAKYPIEKVVTSNVLDESMRVDAINNQVKDSLQKQGWPSNNFSLEAIAGMDPRFPQYVVKTYNDAGMASVGLYTPELEITAEYEAQKKVVDLRNSLIDSLAETKIQGAKLMQRSQEVFGRDGIDFPVDPSRDGQMPERFRLNTLLKTQELVESLLGPTVTAEQVKRASEANVGKDVQAVNPLVDVKRRLSQDRFFSELGED